MSEQGRGNPPDTKWMPAGIGSRVTFRCGKCHLSKETPGRRIKAVCGMRVYVCAKCVGAAV